MPSLRSGKPFQVGEARRDEARNGTEKTCREHERDCLECGKYPVFRPGSLDFWTVMR